MADVAAELSLVEKRQSRIRNRVCKRCKFSTSDSIEFLHHQISAHAESGRDDELLSCDKCDYVSSNHGDLASHKRAHRRSSSFPRQTSTDSETGLMDDTNNNLGQKTGSSTEEVKKRNAGSDHDASEVPQEFACPDCDDVTTSAKAHYRHRVQKHDEGIEVFECDQCDFAATQQQSLNTHRRRSHSASTNTISSPVPSPPEHLPRISVPNNINGETMTVGPHTLDFTNIYRDNMDINQNKERKLTEGRKDMHSQLIGKPNDLAGGMRLKLSNPLATPPVQTQKKTPASGGSGGKPRTGCAPIREAVDPAKYRTIREPDGIKYACSKCGNIYKWRKSLNKHWKEKHDGEIPDPLPTMTQINIPRFPSKGAGDMGLSALQRSMHFPGSQSMKAMNERDSGRKVPTLTSHLNSPALSGLGDMYGASYDDRDYFDGHVKDMKFGKPNDRALNEHFRSLPYPPLYQESSKIQTHQRMQMGGFPKGMKHSPDRSMYRPHPTPSGRSPYHRAPLNQPVFSELVPEYGSERQTNSPSQRDLDDDPLVLDLSKKAGGSPTKPPRTKVEVQPPQDEPLDFSMKSFTPISSDKDGASAFQPIKPEFKQEYNEMNDDELFSQNQPSHGLQCSSCAYIGRNKQDYENHMELHLRKRHHKCAECQQVFFSVEELNRHFLRQHIELIQNKIHGTSPDGSPSKESDQPRAPQLYHYLTTDSKQLLACMVCGAIYQWQWTLAKHFDEDHPSIPNPYSKRNQRPRQSAADGYEPSPKRQRTPDLGPYDPLQCNHCSFMTNSPQELTRHQLKHSLNRNYICKFCGFATKWKEELIQHHTDTHDSLPPMDQLNDEDADYSQMGLTSFMPPGSNQVIDLTAEDTAIVIPQAPEDTALLDPESNAAKARAKKMGSSSAEILLPFKCSVCEYRARWPSEITQHMKNHSDEKPYLCPRCSYRSKWKWDVVKHLKRCGGGTVKDVIDTTKQKKQQQVKALLADVLPPSPGGGKSGSMNSGSSGFVPGTGREVLSNGPPNVTVIPTASSTIMADELEHPDANELGMSSNSNSSYYDDRGLSPTNSSPTPDGSHNSKFKGLVNQGQHYCLQCPFVGNSPAELKRHSRVHSDEKPFICKTCGYSSKWKCDLKKHLKTYNHTSAVPLTYGGHGRKPADWYEQSKEERQELHDSYQDLYASPDLSSNAQDALYKCHKCPYQTNQRGMLDNHVKMHNQQPSQSGRGKLNCKQCHYVASDLSSFLQHKLSHNSTHGGDFNDHDPDSPYHGAEQATPTHRRKAKQQFRVMPTLESNDYMEDSDYEGNEDRSEDMDMSAMELAEDGDFEEPIKSLMKSSKGSRATSYQCELCPFSTSNKSNFEKHNRCHSAASRYMCEWCNWSSNTLNRLYHHAQTMHSKELAQQEKDDFPGKGKGRLFVRDEFPADNAEGEEMAEGIQTKRPSSESLNDDRELAETPPPLRPGTSKRRRRLKTCSKCGYVTDNVTTLQRHMAKHGSNGKFTCEQCDYSVDRLHVLQYHVKIVHEAANERAALSLAEEKTSPKEEEMDNESMDTSEVDGDEPVEPINEGPGDIEEPEDEPSFEIVKLRGATVKLTKSSAGTSYGCLKCPYVNNNITNAVTHTKQHGARKRYTCEFCDYSLDQLRHVVHHMKTIHHSEGEAHDVGILDEGVDTDSLAMDETEADIAEDRDSSGEDTDVYAEKDKPEEPKSSESRALFRSQNFKRFRCNECPYFTGIQRNIKRHRIMHRIIGKKMQCDKCTYKATVAETMRQHIRKNHHHESQNVSGQKANTCKHCPFATDSLGELKNHLRHHGSGMVYLCDFCDYSIDSLPKLRKHRDVHGDEAEFTPVYQSARSDGEEDSGSARKTRRQSARMAPDDGVDCRECPYQARSNSLLRPHMGFHGQQAKYVCDFCTFSSPKSKHIQKHRHLHRDQEVFVSYKPKRKLLNEEYCQAIYAKRVMSALPKLDALQGLIKKYSVAARDLPKGSFLCKSCPFSSNTKQGLAAHNNQHKMSGFYGCDECSFGADRLEVFCKHAGLHLIKSQVKELPSKKSVRCSKCLYCTRSRSLMKIHAKRHI